MLPSTQNWPLGLSSHSTSLTGPLGLLLQFEQVCVPSPLAPLNMHSGWGQGCMEVWTLGAQPRALSGLQCCCWKSILFPTKRHKGQELPHKCSQEECLCGWGGAWGKGETALLKAQVFSSFRALHSTTNASHLRKKRRMARRVPLKPRPQFPSNFVSSEDVRVFSVHDWLNLRFRYRGSVNL